jgi:hypothetical protein
MKDRGVRRANTLRAVRRRITIITKVWGSAPPQWLAEPHRLSKFNMSCGCPMCKAGRKDNDRLTYVPRETPESEELAWDANVIWCDTFLWDSH